MDDISEPFKRLVRQWRARKAPEYSQAYAEVYWQCAQELEQAIKEVDAELEAEATS
jgi:hypothetical protein